MLLAGTSGTGKSTLAGLLAARLGISTVLSTDSVRHMLRSFTPQASNPVLWASTYEVSAHFYIVAGCLQQVGTVLGIRRGLQRPTVLLRHLCLPRLGPSG